MRIVERGSRAVVEHGQSDRAHRLLENTMPEYEMTGARDPAQFLVPFCSGLTNIIYILN